MFIDSIKLLRVVTFFANVFECKQGGNLFFG